MGIEDYKAERIIILTNEFPYGSKESFLENEVEVISRFASKILLIPLSPERGDLRNLPENCEVINPSEGRAGYSGFRIFLTNIALVVKLLRLEYRYSNNRDYFRKNLRKFNSSILQAIYLASSLEAAIDSIGDPKTKLCSYWMNDWALAAAILKMKGKIPRFVFRTHGYDLFDERQPGNYMPFRKIIMEQADMAITVSLTTAEYLKSKDVPAEKVACSYLGTKDHGQSVYTYSNTWHIVSVANLLPLKGVERIVDMLKRIGMEIQWTHFGAGPEKDQLMKRCEELPESVKWEFRGAIQNRELMEFYRNTKVDLAVLFSKTEGLPVSLMEAISFGIPVAATNVGGVSELVNEQTGLLFPEEFDANAAAEQIRELLQDESRYIQMRHSAREFWQSNFEASKNYADFYHRFLE